MSDMFEYLEAEAQRDNIPFKNSAIVSIDRAERNFSSFLSAAQGEKEFQSRLALIAEDIQKIAEDVCEEHGYDNPEHVAKLVVGQLELLSARNSDSSETDGIGNIERQELKPMDPNGYYTEPTIALNPNSAGDHMHNTNPDIPELKPDESQHPSDKKWPWDADLPEANFVDADTPMQPADHHGDSTMTFPNKGQADPVTASKKKSEVLDQTGDFGDYPSVMEKIKEMFRSGASMVDVMRDFGDKLRSWNVTESDLRPVMYEAEHQKRLDTAQDAAFARDFSSPFMGSFKEAAERMDFNSISEMMTPQQAIDHLKESGMEEYEASDRIHWYVNHVNPGWAHKSWMAAVENDDEQVDGSSEDPDMKPESDWNDRDRIVADKAIADLEKANINVPVEQQGRFMGIRRDTGGPHIIFGPQEAYQTTKPSSQYRGLWHGRSVDEHSPSEEYRWE